MTQTPPENPAEPTPTPPDGYPGQPAPGGPAGYPGQPAPGGYPGQPVHGGYPGQPVPGGYPGQAAPGGYAGPAGYPSQEGFPPAAPTPPRRRTGLILGIVGGAVLLLIALVVLGSILLSTLLDGPRSGAPQPAPSSSLATPGAPRASDGPRSPSAPARPGSSATLANPAAPVNMDDLEDRAEDLYDAYFEKLEDGSIFRNLPAGRSTDYASGFLYRLLDRKSEVNIMAMGIGPEPGIDEIRETWAGMVELERRFLAGEDLDDSDRNGGESHQSSMMGGTGA